jgi:hypothetical protein
LRDRPELPSAQCHALLNCAARPLTLVDEIARQCKLSLIPAWWSLPLEPAPPKKRLDQVRNAGRRRANESALPSEIFLNQLIQPR